MTTPRRKADSEVWVLFWASVYTDSAVGKGWEEGSLCNCFTVCFVLFFFLSSQEDDILSTMIRPSWVAPQAWLSFIELDKAAVLV